MMSRNLHAKPLNPGLQASLEVTADVSVTFAAHLHSDRRPVKQLRFMNLSQAGGSDGFVVERLKKLLRGFVEVLLEESVHLSAGQTSLRNFPPPCPTPPSRPERSDLTSLYLLFKALSSRTCRVRMYSGGRRWLKEQRPWPSLMYRPPLRRAPSTMQSAALWWQADISAKYDGLL